VNSDKIFVFLSLSALWSSLSQQRIRKKLNSEKANKKAKFESNKDMEKLEMCLES